MRKYFGTDGVRGRVGEHPMTVDFALRLGERRGACSRPTAARCSIGKDTRLSGYMFEAALEAGFVAAGVNVMLIGPLPTPGIAYLTSASSATSASSSAPRTTCTTTTASSSSTPTAPSSRTRSRRASSAPRRAAVRASRAPRPRHARRQVARALPGILHVHAAQGLNLTGMKDRDRLRERRRPTRSARASSRISAPRSFRSAARRTAATSTTAAARRRRSCCKLTVPGVRATPASRSTATATGW